MFATSRVTWSPVGIHPKKHKVHSLRSFTIFDSKWKILYLWLNLITFSIWISSVLEAAVTDLNNLICRCPFYVTAYFILPRLWMIVFSHHHRFPDVIETVYLLMIHPVNFWCITWQIFINLFRKCFSQQLKNRFSSVFIKKTVIKNDWCSKLLMQ